MDKLGHDALETDESCISRVSALFDCLSDGKVDRRKLGAIVFQDDKKKKQLEDIVHPYILQQTSRLLEENKDDIRFIDIPLLYEGHYEYLCDKVVVIYVNEAMQLERLMARNHYDKNEALYRINAQMSIEAKAEKADYVINNEGDILHLYKQIDTFLTKLEEGSIAWKS